LRQYINADYGSIGELFVEFVRGGLAVDDRMITIISSSASFDRTTTNIVLLYTFLAAFLILIGLTYGMYAGLFACIWPIFWCAGNGV
jgi:hypothetical protein